MSQGAVFKLVLRDDRFDLAFTANEHLRARLAEIKVARKKRGMPNVQPTMHDIEASHMLYLRKSYRPYVAMASEYIKQMASGDKGASEIGQTGGSCEFTLPTHGHFTSDMALHIKFKGIGDPNAVNSSPQTPLLQYCAYPGLRVLKKVEFKSNQVVIDEYTSDEAVSFGKFFVKEDSRKGWEKCHGEQELREANYFANGITGTFFYKDGPQTPKLYQPEFDIFVPLQFDFCRDVSYALLNDLISNTQRSIICHLAPIQELIQASYLNTSNYGEVLPTELPISKVSVSIDLYVNNLFVNPEIHDIFASRIGFSLIRIHRKQVKSLQSPNGSFLLNYLKFPVEYMCVGIRSKSLAKDLMRWHLMGRPKDRSKGSDKILVPVTFYNTYIEPNNTQIVAREATEGTNLENVADSLGLTAHTIDLFPMINHKFYNSYLPNRYLESSMIKSPSDDSAYLMTFCMYPGKYEPSGQYNSSTGRELYIRYLLKDGVEAEGLEMVICASTLNFLVRHGDSVALRFSL